MKLSFAGSDELAAQIRQGVEPDVYAAADFVTIHLPVTPETRGVRPHHTSRPRQPEEYAEFCARMTRRYAG